MTPEPVDPIIQTAIDEHIDARIEPENDRVTLVLSRIIPQERDLIWRALTDPMLLERWSPIVPDRRLTSIGPALSREYSEDEPVDVSVIAVDDGRQLTHRWGHDELTWTIVPTDAGALVELRQAMADPDTASMLAAGWQVCLGRLAVAEPGIVRERVVGQRALDYGWARLRDDYDRRFARDR